MSDLIDPTHDNDEAQAAMQAFLNAADIDEMEEALDAHPLLEDPTFEQSVEALMEHAGSLGDAEAVLRIQDRLDMLYDVLDNLGATPLEEAVEAFLNAEPGDDSTQVYTDYAQWLGSPEALAFLDSMEPADPETAEILTERRATLVRMQTWMQ